MKATSIALALVTAAAAAATAAADPVRLGEDTLMVATAAGKQSQVIEVEIGNAATSVTGTITIRIDEHGTVVEGLDNLKGLDGVVVDIVEAALSGEVTSIVKSAHPDTVVKLESYSRQVNGNSVSVNYSRVVSSGGRAVVHQWNSNNGQ